MDRKMKRIFFVVAPFVAILSLLSSSALADTHGTPHIITTTTNLTSTLSTPKTMQKDSLAQLWLKGKVTRINLSRQSILMKRFRHTKNGKKFYYTKISYPIIKSTNQGRRGKNLTKAEHDFNHIIHRIIKENRTIFIKSVKENIGDLKGKPLQGMPPLSSSSNSLIINSEIFYATKNLISVRFTIGAYFYGAAHPTAHSVTLNYDLNANRALRLADLFKGEQPSRYLPQIARYCEKILMNKIAKASGETLPLNKFMADWIKKGTAPIDKNYLNWNRVAHGILITFDPYQVAPHAVGRLEVFMPVPNRNKSAQTA